MWMRLLLVVPILMCACGGTGPRPLTSPSPAAPPAAGLTFGASSTAVPIVALGAGPTAALPFVLDGRSRTIAHPSTVVGAAAAPEAPALHDPTVSGMVVTITWSPASTGDPATSFVLFYTPPRGGGGSVEIADTSLTATVPMAGEFSVYVCGQNAAGVGGCSAPRTFQIAAAPPPPAGSPPAAPTLQVPSVSGMVVTLTWSPASTGDPATSFVLFYALPGGGGGSVETPETSLAPTVPMAGEISVYVCGKNAAGVGACSATQTFQIVAPAPTARPNPVTNLRVAVSGTTVTLTWDPPAGATPDVTYQIQLPPIGTFDAGPATTASGTMEPGQYTASVYAKNAAGNGAPSNEVAFTVGGCTLPGVPGNLVARFATEGGVTSTNRMVITWSEPSGGGTATTGSGLAYIVGISGPLTATVETFRLETSTDELPAGSYTVTVRAKNSCGTGAAASTTFTIVTTPTGGNTLTYTGAFSGSVAVTDNRSCTYGITYRGSATMALVAGGGGYGGTIKLVGTFTTDNYDVCYVPSGTFDSTGAAGTPVGQPGGVLSSDLVTVGPGQARWAGGTAGGSSVSGVLSITPQNGTGTLTMPLTLTR